MILYSQSVDVRRCEEPTTPNDRICFVGPQPLAVWNTPCGVNLCNTLRIKIETYRDSVASCASISYWPQNSFKVRGSVRFVAQEKGASCNYSVKPVERCLCRNSALRSVYSARLLLSVSHVKSHLDKSLEFRPIPKDFRRIFKSLCQGRPRAL